MKLFNISLNCPFCNEEFSYNTISMKAKHECAKCENELLVRTKPIISIVVSLPGFAIILGLREMLGISKMGMFIDLLYILIGCLLYIGIAYKVVCKIKSPSFLYQVDAQDPTMLERYKKSKKK